MFKKIIKQLKSRSVKAIPVVVFLMVLTSAINIYIVKNDTSQLTSFEKKSAEITKQEQWTIIEQSISHTQEIARQNSKYLSVKTEAGILKEYPKLNELEKEFKTGEFSSKFYNVLRDNLSVDESSNGLFPAPYRTVVATRDGVISIFSNEYHESEKTDKQMMTWDEYFGISPNTGVSQKAIQDVMEQKDDVIVIQNSPYNKGEIEAVDLDVLEGLYLSKGEEALEHFSILAPSFIKDNGDIFGNSDNDFMKDNKSHKLFIIQSIKIGDILDKNRTAINAPEAQQLTIETTIETYNKGKIVVALVWSFLLFAMALILISIYNSERERSRSCTAKTKVMLGGDDEHQK